MCISFLMAVYSIPVLELQFAHMHIVPSARQKGLLAQTDPSRPSSSRGNGSLQPHPPNFLSPAKAHPKTAVHRQCAVREKCCCPTPPPHRTVPAQPVPCNSSRFASSPTQNTSVFGGCAACFHSSAYLVAILRQHALAPVRSTIRQQRQQAPVHRACTRLPQPLRQSFTQVHPTPQMTCPHKIQCRLLTLRACL